MRYRGVPSRRRLIRRRPGAPGPGLHRRHGAGRHPLHAHTGAFGKKYLPETLGSAGRGVSTPTVTAGRTSCFVNSKNWPGRPGVAHARRRCTGTRQRPVHRHHRAVRPRRRAVRHGRRGGRLRQRRQRRCLRHRARRQPSVQGLGGGRFADVTTKAGVADRGILDERALVRLRQGRPARSVRRALRRLVARRPTCSAPSTARASPTARRSRTRARARRCFATAATARSRTSTKRAGLLDPTVEGARRRDARLRRRRLDGSVRGERHAAESAVPKQAGRHVRRRGAWPLGSRSARPAWRAPAWASTRRTTTDRDGPASSSATSRMR